MSPDLIARLEHEYTCACDPATLAAADAHALACYRQQLIDAATLTRLHKAAHAEDRRDR